MDVFESESVNYASNATASSVNWLGRYLSSGEEWQTWSMKAGH